MPRSTYHHGNLKQALVDATVGLIEEKGPLAFTLTEAARRAGVSAAAPYRHFASRDDLLAEVARQGFVEFTERLEAAHAQGDPHPVVAIQRLGTAYLLFAQQRPGLYMAMFESGSNALDGERTSAEAQHAYQILYRAADALFQGVEVSQRVSTSLVANHFWSISHGIVELFTRGAPIQARDLTAEQMLASAGEIYFRGLGVMPEGGLPDAETDPARD
ncbi:TetR/AcrR family transcriptional regulator [Paracoccus sp. DMF-8]|uniref:TetR/AcrR family transcriptional regulator n=1 Tax=Paracoccus sp. DMF-8 TaxID=3019445 RepID=UPI0023E790CA|nr:TetR/AcrR family transcriptional regulator [Paracoccus sp. DMF-8]MDF3605641.1 TetR/AcrR family transcriptional regulator [Paracoccus sp. DMF-8]